jgi:hypothetical protein
LTFFPRKAGRIAVRNSPARDDAVPATARTAAPPARRPDLLDPTAAELEAAFRAALIDLAGWAPPQATAAARRHARTAGLYGRRGRGRCGPITYAFADGPAGRAWRFAPTDYRAAC